MVPRVQRPPPPPGQDSEPQRATLTLALTQIVRARSPVAEPLERREAGLRCRMGPVTEMHDCYKAKVGVFREGLSETEWRDLQQLLTRPQTAPRMLDGEGRALTTRVNNGPVAVANDLAEVELCFWREPREGPSAPGAPRKLVWDVPLEAREVTFPVTFKDLPLP